MQFPEWEDEAKANAQGNDRKLSFLDKVHDCHDYTTEYFLRLQRDHGIRYSLLTEIHLMHAVNYWGDAKENMRENKARYDPTWMRDWLAEGAHLYWDYLPKIVKMVSQHKTHQGTLTDETLVHEAWIMMMFRAFCWWRCHWMDVEGKSRAVGGGSGSGSGNGGGGDGKAGGNGNNVGETKETRLPSRYWNSKFQVYIG